MSKIRVSLSEDASSTLIELMAIYGYESPTHTANVAMIDLMQFIKQQSPREDNNDYHPKQEVYSLP